MTRLLCPPVRACLVAATLCSLLQAALAQTPAPSVAANATNVDGTAYVTRADGQQRVLARGSALNVGDVVSTTRNSTVRLRFTDGGETALRPDSRLSVQSYAYDAEAPQSDGLVLSLLKGGLRAITGAIGKRGNIDAYRLQINTVTIGIRGTDYTARVCDGDCVTVAQNSGARPNSSAPVVARLMQARGAVSVERSGSTTELAQGAPLYAADKVTTTQGGYAVLAFRDDTRLTLNSGTQLALAQYNYLPDRPAQSSMLFRLFSGGLRVATGLIAKSAPSQVRFQTATATVGIRGTVFELACGRADSADNPPAAELNGLSCDNSLFAATRSGEITLAGADGREVSIPAGQAGVVPGAQGSARGLPAVPGALGTLDTPAPETVPVNLERDFGTATAPADNNGFFLMVREGKVVVAQAGQSLQVDAGESAFAAPGQSLAPVKLSTPPIVLDRDPTLSNAAFNFNVCRR
ncbi:MAG: hypothetical protein RLZZ126_1482 [Pseudomonadota bacterium]|jgi:hypothetical protein